VVGARNQRPVYRYPETGFLATDFKVLTSLKDVTRKTVCASESQLQMMTTAGQCLSNEVWSTANASKDDPQSKIYPLCRALKPTMH